MNHCATCGHPLGTGRFCTQCGRPVDQPIVQSTDQPTDQPGTLVPEPDATATMPAVPASPTAPPATDEWRTDTAERPLSTPVPDAPPPTWTPPPPARFPLFADEVDEDDEYGAADPADGVPAPSAGGGPVQTLPVDAVPWGERPERAPRPWGWWGAIAAIVVLVLLLAVWLLSPGDGRRPEDAATATRDGASRTTGSGSPTGSPTGSVTDQASVVVPATAAAGQDVDGNRVTYVGKNMLDGVPETAWRMPGDGTGAEIRLTLPRKTHLTSVGLINGYAKQAQRSNGGTLDWYHGNRRIQKVEWVFDDGTRVAQDLTDTTAVQSTDVDVDTSTITLRLISVSPPGRGPASRDFTAISDVSLIDRG